MFAIFTIFSLLFSLTLSVTSQPLWPPPRLSPKSGSGMENENTLNTRDCHSTAKDPIEQTALRIVKEKYPDLEAKFRSGYTSGGITHAYVDQAHANISFINAQANIAWRGSSVISFVDSFVKPASFASPTPTIDAETAITAAETQFDAKYNNIPVELQYFSNEPENTADLAYIIQVQDLERGVHLEVWVDAHTGDVLSTVNFVASSSPFSLGTTSL